MSSNETDNGCGFHRYYTGENSVYYVYKQVTLGVLLPLIGAFGLLANTLVTFVYSRPSMRVNAVNVYLCALAVSDICTIGSSILLFTTDVFRYRYYWVAQLYGTIIAYLYPLATCFQTVSVYVTLCACMQCYFCVRYTVTKRLYRMPSPRAILPFVVVYGIGWNLSRFFEVDLYPCWEESFNRSSFDVSAYPMRYNYWYNLLYYTVGYTVLMCVGPLLTLTYLAAFIVWQTYFGAAKHRFAADPEAKGDTINLVMVVVMFILCNSLSVVVNLLEITLTSHPLIRYLIDVSNLLVTFNSSVNFLIYHKFSAKFRNILSSAIPTKIGDAWDGLADKVLPRGQLEEEVMRKRSYFCVDKLNRLPKKSMSYRGVPRSVAAMETQPLNGELQNGSTGAEASVVPVSGGATPRKQSRPTSPKVHTCPQCEMAPSAMLLADSSRSSRSQSLTASPSMQPTGRTALLSRRSTARSGRRTPKCAQHCPPLPEADAARRKTTLRIVPQPDRWSGGCSIYAEQESPLIALRQPHPQQQQQPRRCSECPQRVYRRLAHIQLAVSQTQSHRVVCCCSESECCERMRCADCAQRHCHEHTRPAAMLQGVQPLVLTTYKVSSSFGDSEQRLVACSVPVLGVLTPAASTKRHSPQMLLVASKPSSPKRLSAGRRQTMQQRRRRQRQRMTRARTLDCCPGHVDVTLVCDTDEFVL